MTDYCNRCSQPWEFHGTACITIDPRSRGTFEIDISDDILRLADRIRELRTPATTRCTEDHCNHPNTEPERNAALRTTELICRDCEGTLRIVTDLEESSIATTNPEYDGPTTSGTIKHDPDTPATYTHEPRSTVTFHSFHPDLLHDLKAGLTDKETA